MRPLVVVLTGGPCGGKSTALGRLRDMVSAKFGDFDMDSYSVPEVPTVLHAGGCRYPGTAADKSSELLAFERGILALQIAMEDSFLRIANSKAPSRKSVLFLDRGAFDLVSYMGDPSGGLLWNETMLGMMPPCTEESLRARYDGVLFLQSAAVGAEAFYTKSNNAARTETVSEARVLDAKTHAVYQSRFKDLVFLENCDGFETKMARAETAVSKMIKDHFKI